MNSFIILVFLIFLICFSASNQAQQLVINSVYKACFIFVASAFLGIACQAQNLVPNPDFEQYSECPDSLDYDQLHLAKPWFRPTMGTPDYFNTCSSSPLFGVPNNIAGKGSPRSGKAYAGLYAYSKEDPDYREYI